MTVTDAFEMGLPGPVDVPGSLEPFGRWGDDLMDRWDGVRSLRTLPVGGQYVAYQCVLTGTIDQPSVRVTVENPDWVDAVREAILSTFLVPPPQFTELLRVDPVVARLDALYPGLRPVRQFDLLGALVRSISAQQVNLTWAATTRRRLAERFGERHEVEGEDVYSLRAERLASASVSEIRDLQFTTRKAEYIVGVAEAIAGGRLNLVGLASLSDDEVVARLTSLRGIGLWTAEWILARTLGRPRVVAGDLGVRKAVGLAYLGKSLPPEAEVHGATVHWGASAGVAQQLLLHGLSKGLLGECRNTP